MNAIQKENTIESIIPNKFLNTKLTVIKYKPKHTETILTMAKFCEKYKDNILNAISNFIVSNEEQFPYTGKFSNPYKEGAYYFFQNFIYNFNTYAYYGILEQSNTEYLELGAKGLCKVNTYDLQTYKYQIKEMEFIHILP